MIRYFLILITYLIALAAHANLIQALEDPRLSQNNRIPNFRLEPETSTPPAVLGLERKLAPLIVQVRNSHERYATVGTLNDVIHYTCSQVCTCWANKVGAKLRELKIPFRRLQIRAGSSLWVKIRQGNERTYQKYDFHIVIALVVAGKWRIIDPLIIGSEKIERLSVWTKRFDHPELNAVDIQI